MKRGLSLFAIFLFLFSLSLISAAETGGSKIPAAIIIILFIVIGLISLASIVIWIWMLIDCIKREFDNKVLWILIILITGILGAIIYYFVVKRPAGKEVQPAQLAK